MEISRKLLTDVGKHLANLRKAKKTKVSKVISLFILVKIYSQVILFEEQVANISYHLSRIYEEEKKWFKAADVLTKIPMETGQTYVFRNFNSIFNCLSLHCTEFS